MFASNSYIFISYSTQDHLFVDRLIADLQAHDIAVWIDRVSLTPGTKNWEKALRVAIRDAVALILIASPSSAKSDFVQGEIDIATLENKPIYPLWVAGSEWLNSIPLGLGRMQYIDARDERYIQVLPRIIETIRADKVTSAVWEAGNPPLEDHFIPRNPYKGLNAFRERDRKDFFGRDRLIAELIAQLEASLKADIARLLAVIGPSGAGKSSVVMAGILPQLKDGALDGAERWIYLKPMVPGINPIENLSITLSDALPQKSIVAIQQDLDALNMRGLQLLAQQIAREADQRLVLYIDQFEELFVSVVNEDIRIHFIDLLVTAITEPKGKLLLILSMRADFYDRPMNYPILGALIEAQSKVILPMDIGDLRDVIEKPALQDDVRLRFEQGLVAELVYEVRDQEGALPLLQFTLDQLFQRRDGLRLTHVAYAQIGGLRGALQKQAEQSYQRLPSDEHRFFARVLFLRLVELGSTEQDTTRRRATFSELQLPDSRLTAILKEVANTFIDARLLTTNQIADMTTLEVSHEALIREWALLRRWLEEARDDIIIQQKINADATDWLQHNRPTDRLYRGSLLVNAQDWLVRNAASITETDFIERAVEHQAIEVARQERIARRVRNFGWMAVVLALIAALALGATILATYTAIGARSDVNQAEEAQNTAAVARNMAEIRLQEVAAEIATIQQEATVFSEAVDEQRQITNSTELGAVAANLLQQGADAELAALLAIQALRAAYTQNADQALNEALSRIYTRTVFLGPRAQVNDLTYSQDGRYLLSGGDDGIAFLWDTETGDRIQQFAAPSSIASVAISPDNLYVATGIENDTTLLWEVESGSILHSLSPSEPSSQRPDSQASYALTHYGNQPVENQNHFGGITSVNSVVFSQDSRQILSADGQYKLRLWDVANGTLIQEYGTNLRLRGGTFLLNDEFILGSSGSGSYLFEATTGELLRQFPVYMRDSIMPIFTSDSRFLLFYTSQQSGHFIEIWDILSQEKYREFEIDFTTSSADITLPSRERLFANYSEAYHIALSVDDRYLALAGNESVSIWEVATGNKHLEISSTAIPFTTTPTLAFSPSEPYLAVPFISADSEIQIRVYDVEQNIGEYTATDTHTFEMSFLQSGREVLGRAVTSDGRYSGDLRAGRLTLTDLSQSTSRSIVWPYDPDSFIDWFAFDSEAYLLYALVSNNIIRMPLRTLVATEATENMEPKTEEGFFVPQQTLLLGYSPSSFDLSADGRYLLTVGGNRVYLWDVTPERFSNKSTFSPELIRIFDALPSRVIAARFSPNAQQIVIAYENEVAELWNINAHQFSHRLVDVVGLPLYSPDGYTLLTQSAGSLFRLWDTATGRIHKEFEGHRDNVLSLAFSPDGFYILSGSADKTARLWDSETGEQMRVFSNMGGDVVQVGFSLDSQTLIMALLLDDSPDHLVMKYWQRDYRDTIELACRHLFRDLTQFERNFYGIRSESATCDVTTDQIGVVSTSTPTLAIDPSESSPIPSMTPLFVDTSPEGVRRFLASAPDLPAFIGERGILGEHFTEHIVHHATEENREFELIANSQFSYGDFILSSSFEAINANCVFITSYQNEGNYSWFMPVPPAKQTLYLLSSQYIDGNLEQQGNGAFLRMGVGERNHLILISYVDRLHVYLNGYYSGSFNLQANVTGQVMLAMIPLDEGASCNFYDAWIWDLRDEAAFITPSPTITRTPTLTLIPNATATSTESPLIGPMLPPTIDPILPPTIDPGLPLEAIQGSQTAISINATNYAQVTHEPIQATQTAVSIIATRQAEARSNPTRIPIPQNQIVGSVVIAVQDLPRGFRLTNDFLFGAFPAVAVVGWPLRAISEYSISSIEDLVGHNYVIAMDIPREMPLLAWQLYCDEVCELGSDKRVALPPEDFQQTFLFIETEQDQFAYTLPTSALMRWSPSIALGDRVLILLSQVGVNANALEHSLVLLDQNVRVIGLSPSHITLAIDRTMIEAYNQALDEGLGLAIAMQSALWLGPNHVYQEVFTLEEILLGIGASLPAAIDLEQLGN